MVNVGSPSSQFKFQRAILVRGKALVSPNAKSESPSVDHPKSNLLSETNSGALGTRHLDLAVVEDIPAGGLVRGQIVRFYNLNPADVCSNVFRIDFNKRGNVYKLENQIVRDFVRS
jgi:hypothetical protein